MKTSELILLLEDIKKTHGDLDVIILTDTPHGEFHIEPEPDVDMIGVPDENGEEWQVAAIAWPQCFQGPSEPVEPPKTKLKAVK